MTEPVETRTSSDQHEAPDRWTLLGDTLRFQLKLVADALRDVLLSPISLAATLLGLLLHRDNPRIYFDQLMRLGRRSERWINLFGAFRAPRGLDHWMSRLEERLVEQHQRGGLTASAKRAIDRTLDSVSEQLDRGTQSGAASDARDGQPSSVDDSVT